MSLCLVPDCLHKNSIETTICQKCGSKLLVQDRYRAFKLIGQGGFGKTFLAVDEAKPSRPYCVIKQFLPSTKAPEYLEKAVKWFKQEAERLDELGDYPQIPELLAYCNHEGRQYLVQEYIDGRNLAEELANNGVFNEKEIRALLLDILPILDYIHSKQVIHRDIKPENIIKRAKDNKLILVDFGASKELNSGIMGYTSGVIGTAQYAAPEQLRGEPRYTSDLYSLGVTCLHLLTNINPFDLFSSIDNDWTWGEYLSANNPVSDDLARVLDKLVQQAVKKRYQSAEEVLRDLQTESTETQPVWHQPTFVPPPPVAPEYRQENIEIVSSPVQKIQKSSHQENLELTSLRLIAALIAIPYGLVMILDGIGSLIVGSASVFTVFVIPFLVTCCAFGCKNIAKSKNRDELLWFLLGLPFHVVALIIIYCLPVKEM